MSDEVCKLVLDAIKQPDRTVYQKAAARLDMLAKPPGSLGKLEEIAARLCAITKSLSPSIEKRCIIILAADNGVAEEGVSSAPQEVTAIQTMNILNGVTGVGVLAKQFSSDLMVADIGINSDVSHPLLIQNKIRKSTGNIIKEQAMTREEAVDAFNAGFRLAKSAMEKGYQVIGVGEMGIGNTTTSSAVLCALLGLEDEDVSTVVGRGAGLDDAAYQNKIKVIKAALKLHKPNGNDPIDVLCKVGGLDLAAMTGVYTGLAYYGLPVVIDGFISVVAALCAIRLNPLAKEYMFASHHSFERGYTLAVNEIGLSPCLSLDMRLGEGSGCPVMFGIMDSALAVLKNMATFGEAKISDGYLENIREIGEKAF